MSGSHENPLELSERTGPATAVRTAVLALFTRLGSRADDSSAAARERLLEGIAPDPARDRSAAVAALRRRAHAAHATVEGGGAAALDVALDVMADEFEALDRRARNQAEALKAIRLYASEDWVRRIAQQALARPERGAPALPGFLVANGLDEAAISVIAARHIG